MMPPFIYVVCFRATHVSHVLHVAPTGNGRTMLGGSTGPVPFLGSMSVPLDAF